MLCLFEYRLPLTFPIQTSYPRSDSKYAGVKSSIQFKLKIFQLILMDFSVHKTKRYQNRFIVCLFVTRNLVGNLVDNVHTLNLHVRDFIILSGV